MKFLSQATWNTFIIQVAGQTFCLKWSPLPKQWTVSRMDGSGAKTFKATSFHTVPTEVAEYAGTKLIE